jgi:hypothetical protein
MLMSLVGLTVGAMWFSASVMADDSHVIFPADRLAGITDDVPEYVAPRPAATALAWPHQF